MSGFRGGPRGRRRGGQGNNWQMRGAGRGVYQEREYGYSNQRQRGFRRGAPRARAGGRGYQSYHMQHNPRGYRRAPRQRGGARGDRMDRSQSYESYHTHPNQQGFRGRHASRARTDTRNIGKGRGSGRGICYNFQNGQCPYGTECVLQHVSTAHKPKAAPSPSKSTHSPSTQRPCFEFQQLGTCIRGNSCPFLHTEHHLTLPEGLTLQYSDDATSLRYTDKVMQITETQGVIMSSELHALITFDLSDCDMLKEDIQVGCVVEYALQGSKAVHVSFPIVVYRWKQYNEQARNWKICSDQQSVHYEKTYNKNHLNIDTEMHLDGKRLCRFSRFEGKVSRIGYVKYGGRYSVPFESDECDFNMNLLNEGDQLSYEIKREEDAVGAIKLKCIGVKYLPLRYLWQRKDVKAKGRWISCGMKQSVAMDRKYYQVYKRNKEKDITQDGVKYRRITRFIGVIADISEDDGTGTIQFDLNHRSDEDQKESLYTDINVSFRLEDYEKNAFSKHDPVEFELRNENGISMAGHLCNPEYSPQKRRIGTITQIDKANKCGLIEKWPFNFADCNGFDAHFVTIGTRIEYETKYLYKQSAYHAVKICLDLLKYQWLTQSSQTAVWESHGMNKSRELEAVHNTNKTKKTKRNDPRIDVPGHIRMNRFHSKVIELRSKCGLVEDLAIWFDLKECKFDPKYLRKGDQISYELKKQTHPNPLWKITRVRFANLIPFYWQVAHPGNEQYFAVPFRQNFDLEKKYNPSTNTKVKPSAESSDCCTVVVHLDKQRFEYKLPQDQEHWSDDMYDKLLLRINSQFKLYSSSTTSFSLQGDGGVDIDDMDDIKDQFDDEVRSIDLFVKVMLMTIRNWLSANQLSDIQFIANVASLDGLLSMDTQTLCACLPAMGLNSQQIARLTQALDQERQPKPRVQAVHPIEQKDPSHQQPKALNPSNDQVFTDKNSGKRYQRYTTFKGKLIEMPTESKKGKMCISYGKEFIQTLFVDVDPDYLKHTTLERNASYDFEITSNGAGLCGFKVVNVRKTTRGQTRRVASPPSRSTLRYTDKVIEIKGNEGVIMSSKSHTLVTFDLADCGILNEDVQVGCLVRYALQGSKAVDVAFDILDYKWKEYDQKANAWKRCAHGQCIYYENTYNKNHLNITAEIRLDGKRLLRYSRFEGKVIRLNKVEDKTIGYVKYGGRYNVPFESDECDFDINLLNEGDKLSYEIAAIKFKCIDVKFLPLRYLWQQKKVQDDGRDWMSCGVKQSVEMDRKYYKTYMKNNQHDIVENDMKYRRIVRFNGMIMAMSEADGTGTIHFDLDEQEGQPGEDQTESLYTDISVSFRLKDCKKHNFSKHDQVEFQLINENGVCMAVRLTKFEDSRQKRRIGIIAQMDKANRCGVITNVTACVNVTSNGDDDAKQDNERQKWPFTFTQMYGIDCNLINVGTRVEYETSYFYKQSAYHAVKICLCLLPYQWFTLPCNATVWKTLTMDKMRQMEAIYNMNNKNDARFDVPRHLRITRFQRKVVRLGGNGGLVEDLPIWFDLKECDFDPRHLRKNDEISYELKKEEHRNRGASWEITRVRFASLIPFYWQVAQRESKLFCAVPFRQNVSLEKRYNASNNQSVNQVFADKHSGKRYKRCTVFKGKLIQMPTEYKKGKMSVSYDKGFIPNLFVDVDPQLKLEQKISYDFEIAANDAGLPGFKVVNVRESIELDGEILNQTYSSKLKEIDAINGIAKLSIPSRLLDVYKEQFASKEKKMNVTITPGGLWACSLCRFRNHTNVNCCATCGSAKSPSIQENDASKYICFGFSDCQGFDATKLNNDCVLEYKIVRNEKYDVAESGVFPFKAIKVSVPMLCYRWQRERHGKWMSLSRECSIECEDAYNKEHKEIQDILYMNDSIAIRRITTFKRKVLFVDKASKRGQVQINYSEEYGDEIGIWFHFGDCGFNPNYLEPGDDVEYRVEGNKAVRILLWLIPYKWQYKDKNQDKWKPFSYHECIQIEKQHNPMGYDEIGSLKIRRNNATMTARRRTVFRTTVMFDRYNQCHLAVRYDHCNLDIRLPYLLDPSDGIRHNDWVEFEVKRDHKMRRWCAQNVKKVQLESKEKRMFEEIQKQFEELKEDMNTIIEYTWKWKEDDGSYCLYNPDISNKLNRLPIECSIRVPGKRTNYVVRKVSEDSAVQVNQSTSGRREVKRFTIRTPKDEHETPSELSIPDGLYYQNDYQTLNNAEIEQKFYSTVGIYKIHEIEDVVVESKKHQYEVNLWNKCNQLKRSRESVEKYLWHGSSLGTINVIIQNGFDRCYSTTAVYGSGTYFARDASYSVKDRYTPPHSDGYKYMLLCKVIVGDSMLGSSSITKVPKKADGSEYDTLVDTLSNPSIYVAWRDYYAIPLFRIKFRAISIY